MSYKAIEEVSDEMIIELKAKLQKSPDSIELNQMIGEYYLNKDIDEEAEPYIIRALEIDDQIASLHNQIGVIYFKRSDYKTAEYHFKKALQLDFGISEAHFNLAVLCQTQGRYKEALSYYKEVINTKTDDSEVYYLMGQCALNIEMIQESEAFFAESFRLSPSFRTALDLSILYINGEKYSEAEEILEYLLDFTENNSSDQILNDSDKIYLHFTLGLVFEKQEKYVKAIEQFRQVVLADDQNEKAFNHLGECCAIIGMLDEAEPFFAKSSRLDPQYLTPIMNLGKLYFKQEKFQEAINAIEQYFKVKNEIANSQDYDSEEMWNNETELAYELLGKSYNQIGEKAKAMQIWKESLKINPNQPEISFLIDTLLSPSYKRITLSIGE